MANAFALLKWNEKYSRFQMTLLQQKYRTAVQIKNIWVKRTNIKRMYMKVEHKCWIVLWYNYAVMIIFWEKSSFHLCPKTRQAPCIPVVTGKQAKILVCFQSHDYCLAFLRIVPTAEMTVVLVPLAVVVTETTPGRVAVVVRRAGCARGTGTAESHLLFLFWESAWSC